MDQHAQNKPSERQNIRKFRFPARLDAFGKRSWYRYAIALFVIFIAAMFAIALINTISPQQAKENSETDRIALQRAEEQKQALANDITGGKTPEETIQLFLAALKTGDMEQAAQYFMLNTNEQSPYYLTRQEWIDGLNDKQRKGEISTVISTVEKMKPSINQNFGKNSSVYVLLNKDGVADYSLFLRFNTYSNVWKIESL